MARRPSFRIFAKAQKSGKDEVVPATPGFAQFLAETPEAERVGLVFKLPRARGGEPMGAGKVGACLVAIGEKAGVVVDKAAGRFASAHDLRRAFGTRSASRVMPAVLKRLMRHASIETTLGYYVDLDADELADQLWAFWAQEGNHLGNSAQKTPTPTTGAGVANACCKMG